MGLRFTGLSSTAVQDLVEESVEGHTPGIDLGVASRTTNFTTTNTASNNAAGNIPSLSLTFTGTGRPVDLRFFCPEVRHSAANLTTAASLAAVVTPVVSVVFVGTGITDPNNQIGGTHCLISTVGQRLHVVRRTAPLTAGVSYTFFVRAFTNVAGTATFIGATFCPIEFTATSR